MKREKNKTIIFAVFLFLVFLSLTFASANIFTDLWGRFTGKVINAPSVSGNAVINYSQECIECAAPPEGCDYSGASCTSCGTLVCDGETIEVENNTHCDKEGDCVLFEGESVDFDMKHYTIDMIDENYVHFVVGTEEGVNGSISRLAQGESILLSDGTKIKVNKIMFSSRDSDRSYVEFEVISSKGNLTNTTNSCSSGCFSDETCYPIGYRKDGNYCSSDKTFIVQLDSNLACQNSFECSSNLCVNSQCVNEGLFQKILNWFSRLFGGP